MKACRLHKEEPVDLAGGGDAAQFDFIGSMVGATRCLALLFTGRVMTEEGSSSRGDTDLLLTYSAHLN